MLIFTQQVPKIHGANPNTHSTVNSWVIQFFHHFNSFMAWELIHCILRFDIVYFSIASTHFPLWFFTHIYGINVRRRIFIGYKILSNGTCSSLQMIFERRFCREIDLPCGQFRNLSKNIFWWAVFLLEIWTLMDSKRTVLLPSILQNVYKQELEPCQAEWFLLCIALWWEYNLLVLIWTFIYVPHIVKKEIIL